MTTPSHDGPRRPIDEEWGPEDMMLILEDLGDEPFEGDEEREIVARTAAEAARGEREAREVGDGLSYRPPPGP